MLCDASTPRAPQVELAFCDMRELAPSGSTQSQGCSDHQSKLCSAFIEAVSTVAKAGQVAGVQPVRILCGPWSAYHCRGCVTLRTPCY